jgi:hypothetical protein
MIRRRFNVPASAIRGECCLQFPVTLRVTDDNDPAR